MRRERGFSLVEVVVAAGLLGLVLLGIGTLFATARRNITEQGDYRQALSIAQSEIEAMARIPAGDPRLRIQDPDGVDVIAGSMIGARDDLGHVEILNKVYAWNPDGCEALEASALGTCTGLYRRIEWIDDPNFDLDGTGKDYKRVTIVVGWPDPLNPDRLNRVQLETYAAK